MLLTADQIAALVAPTEVVEVDGVGSFKVRGLTVKETDRLGGKEDAATRLLLLALVDGDGNRLFGDDKASVIERLPNAVAKPLTEAILRLSGQKTSTFDPEAAAEKK